MAVLIKGMEMPKSCVGCKLWTMQIIGGKGYDICRASDKVVNATYSKPDWCPLIEVPEQHGRLIEADALLMRINHEVMEAYMDGACYGVHPNQEYLYLLGEIIDDAPTVIPASEEGET